MPAAEEQQQEQQAPAKSESQASEEFTSFYLQRATAEFAEDLDRVRRADDFKASAVGVLVHALQQGAEMFSPKEKRRVTGATEQGRTGPT